jgi:electron transfer flavoprotein beta subunit
VKILVTAKRVYDAEQKLKLNAAQTGVEVEKFVLNAFDELAVEAALRLTEKVTPSGGSETVERIGEVVVVSVGIKDAAQQIRQCLAMGADRGIHVVADDANLDADILARILEKLVAKEKPDLVLMGKQAPDSDSNLVGQILAARLNQPQATFASKIVLGGDKKSVQVTREVDGGLETKAIPLPAVVTTDLRIAAPTAVVNGVTPKEKVYADGPRYASLKGIMAAKKKPIEEVALASLGVDTNLRLKTKKLSSPPPRKAGVKVKTVQELVQKLKTEAKVI